MRASLAIALVLPVALTGCSALLSDWSIAADSGAVDASVDAAGPEAAEGGSGSGNDGSSGSSGGSSPGGSSVGGSAGSGGSNAGGAAAGGSSSGGSLGSSGGSSGSGGSGGVGSLGGAPNDSGSCANDLSNIQGGDFRIAFDVLSTKGAGPLLEQRAVCDPYSTDWIIAEQATYDIIVQIGDGAGYVNLQSVATINDGVWHHILVARVSGTLSITIDGHLDNSIPNGGLSLGPLALLQIGKSACAAPFAGQIKNVCVERK